MQVTIDETELPHHASEQYHFAEAVDMLNTYASKMDTIYHQNDSFIHKDLGLVRQLRVESQG